MILKRGTKYTELELMGNIKYVLAIYSQERFLKDTFKKIGIHENTWLRWWRMLSPKTKEVMRKQYKKVREEHKELGNKLRRLSNFKWREKNKQKMREYQKNWHKNHLKKRHKQSRKNYQKNREKILEKQRAKYWENPEKARAYNRKKSKRLKQKT